MKQQLSRLKFGMLSIAAAVGVPNLSLANAGIPMCGVRNWETETSTSPCIGGAALATGASAWEITSSAEHYLPEITRHL